MALLLLQGFFSGSEIALVNADKLKLRFFSLLFYPLVLIFSRLARLVVRLTGVKPSHESLFVTREKVRMMLEGAEQAANVDVFDRDRLIRAVRFADKTVGEVVNLGYNFEAHLPRRKGRIDALDGDCYRIDGRVLISDVADALGVTIPNTTVHTIGGLVMNRLRHLPRPAESIAISGYLFTVETVSEKGITTIVVESV